MEDLLRVLFNGLALVAVVATWVIAARAYPSLPERIPVHFGWDGKPDAWGGKVAIWILPVVSAVVFLMDGGVIIIGAREPGAAFGVVLSLLRLETAALLLFLEWRMIEVAHGRAEGLGMSYWVPIAVILATALLLAVVAPRRGGDQHQARHVTHLRQTTCYTASESWRRIRTEQASSVGCPREIPIRYASLSG